MKKMRVSYAACTDFTQASVYYSRDNEKAINKRERAGPHGYFIV